MLASCAPAVTEDEEEVAPPTEEEEVVIAPPTEEEAEMVKLMVKIKVSREAPYLSARSLQV